MAKHFLRVEIGDADLLSIGDAELTESQKVPIGETEAVHVGCTDELFTRSPCASVRLIGFDRRDRVQLRVKNLSTQLTKQIKSHKDLQGIYWKICNELDTEDTEKTG
jgi:hypothetical protein